MLWDSLPPFDPPIAADPLPVAAEEPAGLEQDSAPGVVAIEEPAVLDQGDAPVGVAPNEPGSPEHAPASVHQALYRKWRSRSFEDIVGQAHVTRTLRNAVATATVGHAYLFTGTRGTGKTSTARVLARAVNCLNPDAGNPCNECVICRSMEERRSMDLVEIDAASNNSVDDVRDLREKVGYAPSEARRKVYVIDEVHMLSTSAFNALLKTLEEPPRHVLFVLATTEIHRVPATVASRCQRFDFRPISPADTAARLAYVADQEGLSADPAALETLARYATGSLRDALGLLDQVRAFCGTTIGVAEVQEALGIADPRTLRETARLLLAADLAGALRVVDELAGKGADLRQFGRQVVGYWRDLLVARARNAWPDDLGAPPPSTAAIAGVIKAFLQADGAAKRSTAAQLHIELALLDAVTSLSSNGASVLAAATSATTSPTAAPPPSTQRAAPLPPAQRPPAARPPEQVARAAPPSQERAAEPPRRTAEEPAVAAVPSGAAPMLDELRTAWPQLMLTLRQANMPVYALLTSSDGAPLEVGPDYVLLGFSPMYKLLKEKLEDAKKRAFLENVLAQRFGRPYTVRCVIMGQGDGGARPSQPVHPEPTGPRGQSAPPRPSAPASRSASARPDEAPRMAADEQPAQSTAPLVVTPAANDDNFLELAARAFREVHAHQSEPPPLDMEFEEPEP